MVRQLRTKAEETTIPVVMGDMATTVVPGGVHPRPPRLRHDLQPALPAAAARRLALLPVRRHPAGRPLPQPAPVHLAGRTRPDGPARRVRVGDQARGPVRCPLHRRVTLPRLRPPPPGSEVGAKNRRSIAGPRAAGTRGTCPEPQPPAPQSVSLSARQPVSPRDHGAVRPPNTRWTARSSGNRSRTRCRSPRRWRSPSIGRRSRECRTTGSMPGRNWGRSTPRCSGSCRT